MKVAALWLLLLSAILVLAGYMVALIASCDAWHNHSYYCDVIPKFSKYYADNIRGHLFAGFLALGGFLLSLKTFIVVTMKENVYDDKKYIENWEKQNKLDPTLRLYAPLKQLSDFLYYAILASMFSAILQMSLGLFEHWIASAIAIWSAIYATLLLTWCLILIKRNIDTWFTYLDAH
jgi:hypothetical protein